MMSLSTLVGNTSNLQDLVGMDIIIFSTSSSVSLVSGLKLRASIKCIPDFPDFVYEKSSTLFSQFLITHGGG